MQDKFPFVIDGFPRTGSTSLTRALDAHPDIACCMEPFHPTRFNGEFNRLACRDGMREALRTIRIRWNGLKHVWEPGTAWPFIGFASLNDDLVRNAEIVIVMRRRNLLRQYVSAVVSRRLGFWVGTASEFKMRFQHSYPPVLDLKNASRALFLMTDALARRDSLLESTSCKQIRLYYEDIFERGYDYAAFAEIINSLFEALGHRQLWKEEMTTSVRYLNPGEFKWMTNEIYECLPNAKLLDKELGSKATGYLLR